MRELLQHARNEVTDDLSYAVLVVCLKKLIISARLPFVDYHRVPGEYAQPLVPIFFLYHEAIREQVFECAYSLLSHLAIRLLGKSE